MKCENCKFFYQSKNMEKFFGQCRRYPPQNVRMSKKVMSLFPTLHQLEWCGEYQPKPKKKGKDE